MPLNTLGNMPRKVMTLFLLVDTSGSMAGSRIGSVNAAIEELPALLKQVSDENADAEIRLAVMEFSTGCRWVTAQPMELEAFFWNDLTAGGVTDMGAAFGELNSKLSREAFLKSNTGAFAPVIILLSDGGPTDSYGETLAQLRQNNWFRSAMKIAIAVEEADTAMLAEFTGTPETVVWVRDDPAVLKKLLSRMAVVSSTMQSRSKSASAETDDAGAADALAAQVIREVIHGAGDPGAVMPVGPAGPDPGLVADQAHDDDNWGQW